jgi:hypothetical protein
MKLCFSPVFEGDDTAGKSRDGKEEKKGRCDGFHCFFMGRSFVKGLKLKAQVSKRKEEP